MWLCRHKETWVEIPNCIGPFSACLIFSFSYMYVYLSVCMCMRVRESVCIIPKANKNYSGEITYFPVSVCSTCH